MYTVGMLPDLIKYINENQDHITFHASKHDPRIYEALESTKPYHLGYSLTKEYINANMPHEQVYVLVMYRQFMPYDIMEYRISDRHNPYVLDILLKAREMMSYPLITPSKVDPEC